MLVRGSMDPDGVDTKVSDASVILTVFSSTDCTSVLWTLKFSFSDAMASRGTEDVTVMGMEGEEVVVMGTAIGEVIKEETLGKAVVVGVTLVA
jgi:hypothetical protein